MSEILFTVTMKISTSLNNTDAILWERKSKESDEKWSKHLNWYRKLLSQSNPLANNFIKPIDLIWKDSNFKCFYSKSEQINEVTCVQRQLEWKLLSTIWALTLLSCVLMLLLFTVAASSFAKFFIRWRSMSIKTNRN